MIQDKHCSQGSDDEGIDSENDQVKHYSTDGDDMDPERPVDPLKPPNPFLQNCAARKVVSGIPDI